MTNRITDTDLSAFLDGELESGRAAQVEQELAIDTTLARRLNAFAADRRLTAALFAPVAGLDLPAAWQLRLSRPTRPPAIRSLPVWAALAAGIVLAVIGARFALAPRGDQLIAEALQAGQTGLSPPSQTHAALPVIGGMAVRPPDLARFGLALAAVGVHPAEHAVSFLYRNPAGEQVTLFVRPSPGSTRFEMTQSGGFRVCIWQDDVLTAVLAGHMEAGAMMRLAAAAYAALSG